MNNDVKFKHTYSLNFMFIYFPFSSGSPLIVSPDDVVSIESSSVDEPFILLDVSATFTGATSVTVELVDENGDPLPGYPPITV